MSIPLAIHDAATNCQRDGATAIVTLKSGAELRGTLEKSNMPLHVEGATLHMRTATGWITALVDEVAAVEATKR